MSNIYKNLITKLQGHKRIGVFSHLRPDGDCIGAQIAMSLWLKKNGIDCIAFNEDPLPDNLNWLEIYHKVHQPENYNLNDFDAFLFVDGNALHRFGKNAEKAGVLEKPMYMIDHHPQPDDIFEASVSVVKASSSCELVYNIFKHHNPDQIDEGVAKALYTGLVTDTGSFQFQSVTHKTMRAAADLLERGNFRPDAVIGKVYSSRRLNELALLSKALDTIEIIEGCSIATMRVYQSMLDETGTTKEDTEGFVQYPLSLEDVHACVFFREDKDRIKISFRSNSDDIDVNLWARKFNGGGHKRASGALYIGSMEEAVSTVVTEGILQLKEN